MKIEALARKYRIDNPEKFRLTDIDPGDTAGLAIDKDDAKDLLQESIRKLADYQEMLYAQDRWSVLAIFQAMDAAGNDGAIKHVMSGINPQGCQVYSFKAPTSHELDHDFMWRTSIATPERGRIGIFNRSYYEEVLVVRAHPEILAKQKLPPRLVGKDIWKERFEDIRAFETYQARNGMLILKFFLHVSKDEQAARFLERIDDPAKNWKFNLGDVAERKLWETPGVYVTAVGYAGGSTPNPTYQETCTGMTGHTEAVLVVYDPAVISLEALLKVFFEAHNPTQGMRQGNDVGTQYRSAIYLADPAELEVARRVKSEYQAALLKAGHGTITTEIAAAGPFYYAEDYHQQYLAKNPNGYCGIGGTGVSCPIGLPATGQAAL